MNALSQKIQVGSIYMLRVCSVQKRNEIKKRGKTFSSIMKWNVFVRKFNSIESFRIFVFFTKIARKEEKEWDLKILSVFLKI